MVMCNRLSILSMILHEPDPGLADRLGRLLIDDFNCFDRLFWGLFVFPFLYRDGSLLSQHRASSDYARVSHFAVRGYSCFEPYGTRDVQSAGNVRIGRLDRSLQFTATVILDVPGDRVLGKRF